MAGTNVRFLLTNVNSPATRGFVMSIFDVFNNIGKWGHCELARSADGEPAHRLRYGDGRMVARWGIHGVHVLFRRGG